MVGEGTSITISKASDWTNSNPPNTGGQCQFMLDKAVAAMALHHRSDLLAVAAGEELSVWNTRGAPKEKVVRFHPMQSKSRNLSLDATLVRSLHFSLSEKTSSKRPSVSLVNIGDALQDKPTDQPFLAAITSKGVVWFDLNDEMSSEPYGQYSREGIVCGCSDPEDKRKMYLAKKGTALEQLTFKKEKS